jgi:hypothetical protein
MIGACWQPGRYNTQLPTATTPADCDRQAFQCVRRRPVRCLPPATPNWYSYTDTYLTGLASSRESTSTPKLLASEWPEYQDVAFPAGESTAVKEQGSYIESRIPRTEGTDTHTVEFESPDPPARKPSGLLPARRWSPRMGLTLCRAGSHRRQVRASSFSPTLPSACTSSGERGL